jgi:hypothetical protein
VSAFALLDELAEAGIRLSREGDDLIGDVLPGADLDPYRERIQADKPALLTLLALQYEIGAAANAARDAFDRAAYDRLWGR